VFDGARRIAALAGNFAQAEMRRRSGQQFKAAIEVRHRAVGSTDFLVGDSSLQVVVEESFASADRPIVIGNRHVELVRRHTCIAAKRVEVCLVAVEVKRLVGQAERFVNIVLGQRFAALVISVVRRLVTHGLRHRRLVGLAAEFAAGRQACRCRDIGTNPFLRRWMTRKKTAQPVRASPLAQP
jgi:hypothetical protein